MKKWSVVIVLGLRAICDGAGRHRDERVHSTVVDAHDTTVAAMQAAITFYTLTMAARAKAVAR